MRFEIELHVVPHLNGLIIETYLVGKSEAVPLHNQNLVWKVPILLINMGFYVVCSYELNIFL